MIETDASLVGWGAVCKRVQTGGGLWSREEQEEHINVLELMAGIFAVQAFAKGKQKVHVHLRMDNTSALSYVTRMGGTRSTRLTEVARQMWDWCFHRQIILSASHLPGLDNQVADQESRQVQTSAECKLHKKIFNKICVHLGPCTVDLFTTRLNHQLDKYVSWRPDPGAMTTNALHISWVDLDGYAFPTFCLLGKCLQKVRMEQSTVVLVEPLWRN